MDDLKNILESLLFVAEDPLSIDRLVNVLNLPDKKMIREALNELTADYEARGGAFTLHEVAGGFQFRSRPEYVPWIKQLLQPKPSRLSRAALETLAIIAYKQPIIRSDIEHLRGVDCGGVLRMLMERKLVRVLGRKEIPGRPLIYATTKQFLEVFDLKNLRDLPTPKEIEALTQSLEDAEEEDVEMDGELTAEQIELPDDDIDEDLRAVEKEIPKVDADESFGVTAKGTGEAGREETSYEDEDDDLTEPGDEDQLYDDTDPEPDESETDDTEPL